MSPKQPQSWEQTGDAAGTPDWTLGAAGTRGGNLRTSVSEGFPKHWMENRSYTKGHTAPAGCRKRGASTGPGGCP